MADSSPARAAGPIWMTQRSSIGFGISILSFACSVRAGVFADSAILEDPRDSVNEIEPALVHVGSVL